jgi:hydroxypyruvate reductase
MTCSGNDHKGVLRALFNTAVEAVSAAMVLPGALPPEPKGRTVLLAVGKAASAMADVALSRWRGPISGLVVTRHGHGLPALRRHRNIEVIEAGHPVPDENSVRGAREALQRVANLSSDDLVLTLISGGGSALWCLPLEPVTLADKQRITRTLLSAGASIRELNTVRKWISGIKGGQLARAAHPARVETLIISDVVDNSPGMIASGPTTPLSEPFAEFEAIVKRYALDLPPGALEAVQESAARRESHEIVLCHSRIIAMPTQALRAAETKARELGYVVECLGDCIEGEARLAAKTHAEIARRHAGSVPPVIILSGGEVTVTVENDAGIGGPTPEVLLALAIELEGCSNVFALACDTDGYDGIGTNAGAIVTPDTLARAAKLGLDPREFLEQNDSFSFFNCLGDLVTTGPTQTNVSDFRAIIVCGGEKVTGS